MARGTTHLKPHEARILGATNAFTEAAPMVECFDQPCTFLVQKVDGFRCVECREVFCTDHRTAHHCPAREDRKCRELSERRTKAWDPIKFNKDNAVLVEAERYFGFGPLYHVKRKGRWYYYRFRSIRCWRMDGEPVWTVWATRTNKDGNDDLGYMTLELEHLTQIEPAE